MTSSTPIFDDVHRFMQSMSSMDLAKSFNRFSIGIEQASMAWERAERVNRERKEKLRKEKEACLHGRSPFEIDWRLTNPLKCPQCCGLSVYVSPEELWCLHCGWSRWQIGKQPSR